jgi:superfamily II DNA or RNA helicase
VQNLKQIQIRPGYSGTLESLTQEFLKAGQHASKTVLIRLPLPGISNWKFLLETLIANSHQQVSLIFEIPDDKSLLSLEIITNVIRDIVTNGDLVFNSLLLKILNSTAQITFDSFSHIENEKASRCALMISDSAGETVNFQVSNGSGNDVRMSADWSWGNPDCVAQDEKNDFQKIWEQSVEKGFNDSSLRQALREILSSDRVSSISGVEKLFPHQSDGVSRWVKNLYRGIFEMCTGAGKTIASLAALKTLIQELAREKKQLSVAIVICPTQVLVEQWEQEIIQAGFEPPLLAYDSVQNYVARLGISLNGNRHSGLRIIVTTDVTFSSAPFLNEIQTATEAGTKALLIADEMHNYSSPAIRQTLKATQNYFAFRLGLSATPDVEGNEPATKFLSEYFGPVVGEYSLRQAVQDKVLCSYKYYPCPVFLDTGTSVKYLETLREIDETVVVNASLYRQRNDLLRRSGVQINALESIVDEIRKVEYVSHTLVFCPPGRDSTDEEERLLHRVKKVFEERGILTTSIVAGTPARERPTILKAFAKGDFQVLLAIGCLDEGMNVPCIKRAIMLYSLDRRRQFIQRRGRILRRADGKDFAIINDIVILPHNSEMSESEAKTLLRKELRRYEEFASMAMNKDEAQSILEKAFEVAATKEELPCLKA